MRLQGGIIWQCGDESLCFSSIREVKGLYAAVYRAEGGKKFLNEKQLEFTDMCGENAVHYASFAVK